MENQAKFVEMITSSNIYNRKYVKIFVVENFFVVECFNGEEYCGKCTFETLTKAQEFSDDVWIG